VLTPWLGLGEHSSRLDLKKAFAQGILEVGELTVDDFTWYLVRHEIYWLNLADAF